MVRGAGVMTIVGMVPVKTIGVMIGGLTGVTGLIIGGVDNKLTTVAITS